jgi:hypothetical protein
MTRTAIVCLLLLLPLTGCTLFQSKATRALHASPDFQAGYSDGCASAQDSSTGGTTARDDQAFSGNAAYNAGWREGLGACRMLSMPGPSMTPQ